MKDSPEYYLSHIRCSYRQSGWFQAPNHDDRNLIIRDTSFLLIWRDNPYYRFQLRGINRRIRELLQDYGSFLVANGKVFQCEL